MVSVRDGNVSSNCSKSSQQTGMSAWIEGSDAMMVGAIRMHFFRLPCGGLGRWFGIRVELNGMSLFPSRGFGPAANGGLFSEAINDLHAC